MSILMSLKIARRPSVDVISAVVNELQTHNAVTWASSAADNALHGR